MTAPVLTKCLGECDFMWPVTYHFSVWKCILEQKHGSTSLNKDKRETSQRKRFHVLKKKTDKGEVGNPKTKQNDIFFILK